MKKLIGIFLVSLVALSVLANAGDKEVVEGVINKINNPEEDAISYLVLVFDSESGSGHSTRTRIAIAEAIAEYEYEPPDPETTKAVKARWSEAKNLASTWGRARSYVTKTTNYVVEVANSETSDISAGLTVHLQALPGYGADIRKMDPALFKDLVVSLVSLDHFELSEELDAEVNIALGLLTGEGERLEWWDENLAILVDEARSKKIAKETKTPTEVQDEIVVLDNSDPETKTPDLEADIVLDPETTGTPESVEERYGDDDPLADPETKTNPESTDPTTDELDEEVLGDDPTSDPVEPEDPSTPEEKPGPDWGEKRWLNQDELVESSLVAIESSPSSDAVDSFLYQFNHPDVECAKKAQARLAVVYKNWYIDADSTEIDFNRDDFVEHLWENQLRSPMRIRGFLNWVSKFEKTR